MVTSAQKESGSTGDASSFSSVNDKNRKVHKKGSQHLGIIRRMSSLHMKIVVHPTQSFYLDEEQTETE